MRGSIVLFMIASTSVSPGRGEKAREDRLFLVENKDRSAGERQESLHFTRVYTIHFQSSGLIYFH